MNSRLGTGRWSDVTDEVQPFGMSFVDIVASALICVIALLILWLQFIDPLGVIPGRSERAGADSQAVSAGAADKGLGYNAPALMLSLLARWPESIAPQGRDAEITVRVGCDGDRRIMMQPNADGYAARTVHIASMTTGPSCTVEIMPGKGAPGDVVVEARVITDGKRPRLVRLATSNSTTMDVLASFNDKNLKEQLELKDDAPWTFDWTPGSGR